MAMKRISYGLLSVVLCLCLCTACQSQNDSTHHTSSLSAESASSADSASTAAGYRQITQEEAARLMAAESGYILLDVRTQEEYAAGHIPQAICIPNETIGEQAPEELPDKDQLILVYCRSGRRSKEAAAKLAAIGYTNIVEFGGILTWTGEDAAA